MIDLDGLVAMLVKNYIPPKKLSPGAKVQTT